MADAALPAAGWYADGSTVGVHRWFDGTAWTEHTIPEPGRHPALASAPAGHASQSLVATAPATLPDSRFATAAPGTELGGALPSRLAIGMSPADYAEREAAIAAHRLGEARQVRRGAIGAFCTAVVLLSATSGISLALRSPDELWGAGALGAAYLVWRAARKYSSAVFRGAPRLPVAWIALGTVAVVAAVGLFVAVPVEAAHTASHALDGVTGLTGPAGLQGLTDPNGPSGLTDPSGLPGLGG